MENRTGIEGVGVSGLERRNKTRDGLKKEDRLLALLGLATNSHPNPNEDCA